MAKFVILFLIATFVVVSQQAPLSPEAPSSSSHDFNLHNTKSGEHQVSHETPKEHDITHTAGAKPANVASLHHILTDPLPVKVEPAGHDSYHGTPSVREATGTKLQENNGNSQPNREIAKPEDPKVNPASSPSLNVASSASNNGQRINTQINTEHNLNKPVVGPVPNFGLLANTEGVKNGQHEIPSSPLSHHQVSFQVPHHDNQPSHHLHTRETENKQDSSSKPAQHASTIAHDNKQADIKRPTEVHQSGTPTYYDHKVNKDASPAVPQVGHQLHARDATAQQKPGQIASSIAQPNKQSSSSVPQTNKPLNTHSNQNKPTDIQNNQNKPSSTQHSQSKPASSTHSQSAHNAHKRDVLYEEKPAAKPGQIASSFSEQTKKPAASSSSHLLNSQQNNPSTAQNTQYKPYRNQDTQNKPFNTPSSSQNKQSNTQNPSTSSSTTQATHTAHKRDVLYEDKPAAKPAHIASTIAEPNKQHNTQNTQNKPSSTQNAQPNLQTSQNKQSLPQNSQSNAHQVRTRDAFPQQNAPKPAGTVANPSSSPSNTQNNKPSLSSPVNPQINKPTSSLNFDIKPAATKPVAPAPTNGKPAFSTPTNSQASRTPGSYSSQGARVTREVFIAGSEDDLLALASDNSGFYDSDHDLEGRVRRFRVLPGYLGG